MKQRTKSTIAVALITLLFLLMGYVEGMPAGQPCNWASDCGLNETCKSLKYYQRDDVGKTGICVPKEWKDD